MNNDWDVSMQGHCVSGTIHFGDQGSQKIRTGTSHFRTSRPKNVIFLFSGMCLINWLDRQKNTSMQSALIIVRHED